MSGSCCTYPFPVRALPDVIPHKVRIRKSLNRKLGNVAPGENFKCADAIVMREKEHSRWQREKKSTSLENMDVGDLIVSGVEMLWKLIRH